MMAHDYIDSLLSKKSIEDWCNLTRTEVINHTLRGTKLYRDYQRAINYEGHFDSFPDITDAHSHSSLDGASRRDDYIHGT
jgi:hypothetical protein